MRLVLTTIFSLIVSIIIFLIIKLWGSSQLYIDYNHPFYKTASATTPLQFIKPSWKQFPTTVKTTQPLYLDVAITRDGNLIIPALPHELKKEEYRNKYDKEITDGSYFLENYKADLQNKKIIFNIIENPTGGHQSFYDSMKTLGLQSGENILILSPYEALPRSLKELAPTFIYGSTKPEILRIKALESLFLIEAATFRADVIIYPLEFSHQPFFTETLMKEMKRRFKRVIIGPIKSSELNRATNLNPFGVILEAD